MMESPDLIEQRIKKLEDALGITGTHSPVTRAPTCTAPVGAIVITATEANSFTFGTWTLLHSGIVLGGQVGTVYVWKRTA